MAVTSAASVALRSSEQQAEPEPAVTHLAIQIAAAGGREASMNGRAYRAMVRGSAADQDSTAILCIERSCTAMGDAGP